MFDPGCTKLLKSVKNPTGTRLAIIFLKGGNATESDSIQISVKDADDKLDETEVGNAFIADSDHGKAAVNTNQVDLRWIGNYRLLITYNKKLRTFIKVTQISDVALSYRER